jgi:hypothetical protein
MKSIIPLPPPIIRVGRLPDEVVNRIVVGLENNEEVPAIQKAT